jgi:hypothetical protein
MEKDRQHALRMETEIRIAPDAQQRSVKRMG